MRKHILLVLLTLAAATAGAQSTDWHAVEQLAKNTPIRVTDFSHSETCYFLMADETYLTCERRREIFFFFTLRERSAFRKGEVRVIRGSRPVRSALAGAVIGLGAGAGLGAIIDAQAKDQAAEAHGGLELLAYLGTFIGLGIGAHTDFLAGPVLYRQP